MKTLNIVAAVTLSAIMPIWFVAGMKVEAMTHAYQIHAITGAPLLQVLDPIHRNWSVSPSENQTQGDDEEVCGPNLPCESNQD